MLTQSSSCEKIKSQNNDINKSTDHIDRGFELILSGGKRKRPKSFRLLLDKMILLCGCKTKKIISGELC